MGPCEGPRTQAVAHVAHVPRSRRFSSLNSRTASRPARYESPKVYCRGHEQATNTTISC